MMRSWLTLGLLVSVFKAPRMRSYPGVELRSAPLQWHIHSRQRTKRREVRTQRPKVCHRWHRLHRQGHLHRLRHQEGPGWAAHWVITTPARLQCELMLQWSYLSVCLRAGAPTTTRTSTLWLWLMAIPSLGTKSPVEECRRLLMKPGNMGLKCLLWPSHLTKRYKTHTYVWRCTVHTNTFLTDVPYVFNFS